MTEDANYPRHYAITVKRYTAKRFMVAPGTYYTVSLFRIFLDENNFASRKKFSDAKISQPASLYVSGRFIRNNKQRLSITDIARKNDSDDFLSPIR